MELAALYGVSRGPVREAIRELEKHGLAVLHPRRGAYVIGVSLDLVAESFNIRAALAGVAATCLGLLAVWRESPPGPERREPAPPPDDSDRRLKTTGIITLLLAGARAARQ